jgi:hypothetical protein
MILNRLVGAVCRWAATGGGVKIDRLDSPPADLYAMQAM